MRLKTALPALLLALVTAGPLVAQQPPASPAAPSSGTPVAPPPPPAPTPPAAPSPTAPEAKAPESKPAEAKPQESRTPGAKVPEAKNPENKPEEAKPAEAQSMGTLAEVPARPVLRLKGKSTWDDGFDNLRKALDALEAEAAKHSLARDGVGMAYFIDSDDNGFTFEAMVPLKEAAPATLTLPKDMEATLSPAGRAVVFHHEGSYDDIDTAYEAFAAWLDDKNLVSTGKFLEEYLHWPGKEDEGAMKIRISVFLK